MAQPRLSMRKIREVLRLRFEAGLSRRQIALSVSCSRAAVAECLRRAAASRMFSPLEMCSRARCNLSAVTTGFRKGYSITRYYRVIRGPLWQRPSRSTTR